MKNIFEITGIAEVNTHFDDLADEVLSVFEEEGISLWDLSEEELEDLTDQLERLDNLFSFVALKLIERV